MTFSVAISATLNKFRGTIVSKGLIYNNSTVTFCFDNIDKMDVTILGFSTHELHWALLLSEKRRQGQECVILLVIYSRNVSLSYNSVLIFSQAKHLLQKFVI